MARASRTSQARAARQAKMLYDMCAMAIVAGRADLDGADEVGFDIELPMFTVGRAGELANVHPQTLRQYDRLGLVVPQRTDAARSSVCASRPVPACSQLMQMATLWRLNVPAVRACGVGRFRSMPDSCHRVSSWSPRVPRPTHTTRPMGLSYAKTRVFRGVNPPLSPFLGQSCFGGIDRFSENTENINKTGISCNRCACFVI